MIVDLRRFVAAEQPYWAEMEGMLNKLENQVEDNIGLEEARRFHYLCQRCSSDLAKLDAFPSEPRVRLRLESLVARAYSELHETREKGRRFSPRAWFFQAFPRTFRRHYTAFLLVVVITLAGCAFGGLAMYFDPASKRVFMPFSHLMMDPSERVKREETAKEDRLEGQKGSFSAYLMTHNTKVSILTLAMGISWGVGTIMLLFYNGVILGAVAADYIIAGETKFLAGWLLPHGSIEIPAILIAGQAGLVLGKALIGRGSRETVKIRLRKVGGDLVTLIFGVAVLLVWAGMVEAFFSQYHEPVLPYSLKIAFGLVEMALLTVFLARSGKSEELKAADE